MDIQLSFQELRKKDVINLVDGRRLGRIIDVIFNVRGQILGVVTPGFRRFLFFKSCDDIFIQWCDIKKIGDDCILVELRPHKVSPHQGCDPCPPPCGHHDGPHGNICYDGGDHQSNGEYYYCSDDKDKYYVQNSANRPKYYYESGGFD